MNKIFLTILFLLSLLFSLTNLGKWAFMDYDEAIYAKVYHESLTRNNFFTFTYLNEPWFEKPPLYFWLAKGSATLFGKNEFSLRLPSAMLTTISILLVLLIVLELTKDWTAALLSAAILTTTAYFLFTGRQLRLDIPVTSSILLSIYAFLKGRDKPFWFLIFGMGIACGILFKIVIGLLVYPIITLYALIYREYKWLKNKWFWIGNILALILIVPWHFYQSLLFGQRFWDSYFLYHVFERTIETITFGDRTPFLYYFQQLFIVNQPWFFIFILSAIIFLIHSKTKLKDHRFELFTLFITIAIFLLFYLPQTKLLYYFTPMLPFMAMFIGSFMAKLLKKQKKAILLIFILLAIVGVINTSLRIFSDKERGVFLQPLPKISRYAVAKDEKLVAEIAGKEKLPLYLYNWEFFPTLIYYSELNEVTNLQKVIKGTSLKPPFLLLIPTPLFKGSLPVSVSTQAKAKSLFNGQAATLIKVSTK